jgi:predicted transcriptional regulator
MNKRRSKLEIYLEVLQIIKDGTSKPTQIMYNANISWKPLIQALNSMISQDLIREIDVNERRTGDTLLQGSQGPRPGRGHNSHREPFKLF